MKEILILVFNDLRHDARVARQVDFLSRHGKLTIVCFDAPPELPAEIIRIPRIKPGLVTRAVTALLLLLRFFEPAYRMLYGVPSLVATLRKRRFDLVVANDIECLPLAFQVNQGAKVLFDAHEYAPRHFEDKRVWRIFFQPFTTHLCRTWLPKVDAMTTVSEGLKKEYAKNFGVSPVVITNASTYHDLQPSPLVPGRIRLVHHGAANPSRQLELTIRMMDFLDERFELTLMLLTPAIANTRTRAYLDHLQTLVASQPRVRLIPAVASHEVVNAIHDHDIGIFLLPPVNFNYANTLPNKFFDFVQARLAVAIGPTPEMAHLIQEHGFGIVSGAFTPESLAAALNALKDGDIVRMKEQAHRAAPLLSAEGNRRLMDELLDGLAIR
ncbi:MAG: glycosyltransferase [Cyclobacteriaceae bacterium]|nr:glycosyltransferase [Cyclobacteriaceae bacterium]